MSALEMISDTFLPVNEIAQFAVPEILRCGGDFLCEYSAWIRKCHDAALRGLDGLPFVSPRGGFYITLPVERDEQGLAIELLRDCHILTHPGYYYDIRSEHLVMTFIGDPQHLEEHFHQIAGVIRR
jgi:aspartate/methionine/tyrosine aminotransferase